MTERILFVDDEPDVLARLEYQSRRYMVQTALGGQAGLAAVDGGPFAVVVSDMRMPVVSGTQFLAEVRRRQPDAVRLLLAGAADLSGAIAAVNEGDLFRCLTKPCDTDPLTAALDAALRQYRLVTAERELLDRTLRGSVQVLGEVLALANPTAFGRALRVQGVMREVAAALPTEVGWELDVAAILSQLGLVAIPERVITAADRGQPLSAADQAQLDHATGAAADFVARIPRLEPVARAITASGRPTDGQTPRVVAPADLLRLASDFDRLLARGIPRPQAFELLRAHADRHHPAVVAALGRVVRQDRQPVSREVTVATLTPGMTLELDLYSTAGVFLLRQGSAITIPIKLRLEALAASGQIPPILRVLVPVTAAL